MRLKRVLFALVFGAALAIPAQARADWFFTPFIGANLHRGGDTLGFDTKNGTVNFGGSLGFMGGGIFGFEVDFGYAPNFFENEEVTSIDGNVTTLMGNLIIGIPIGGQTGGGMRPYVSGGVGLLRSRVDDVDDFFDVDREQLRRERRRRRDDLLQRQRRHPRRHALLPQHSTTATRTASTCLWAASVSGARAPVSRSGSEPHRAQRAGGDSRQHSVHAPARSSTHTTPFSGNSTACASASPVRSRRSSRGRCGMWPTTMSSPSSASRRSAIHAGGSPGSSPLLGRELRERVARAPVRLGGLPRAEFAAVPDGAAASRRAQPLRLPDASPARCPAGDSGRMRVLLRRHRIPVVRDVEPHAYVAAHALTNGRHRRHGS